MAPGLGARLGPTPEGGANFADARGRPEPPSPSLSSIMTSRGFVELSAGDITLARRLVALACRWSDAHQIVVWVRGIERRWVDLLVEEELTAPRTPIRLLAADEDDAAIREAKAADFWVVSSPDLVEHLGSQQVCVFWPLTAFAFGSLEKPPSAAAGFSPATAARNAD